MKRFILFCTLPLFCLWIHAQGILFKEGNWKEIQEMARQENKPIFLDVYTSW